MSEARFALLDIGTTKIGEVFPKNATWTQNVKDPAGTVTFTTPYADRPAALDVGVDLMVYMQSAWRWRGQIVGRRVTWDGATFVDEWNAVGLFDLLADRYLPAGSIIVGDEPTAMFSDLFAVLEAQADGDIVSGQALTSSYSSGILNEVDLNLPVGEKVFEQPISAKDAILQLAEIYPVEVVFEGVSATSYVPTLWVCPGGVAAGGVGGSALGHLTVGVDIESIQGIVDMAPGSAFCNYATAYTSTGVGVESTDTTSAGLYRRRDKIWISSEDDDSVILGGKSDQMIADGAARMTPIVRLAARDSVVRLGSWMYINSDGRLPIEPWELWRVIGVQVGWRLDEPGVWDHQLTLEPWPGWTFP